MTVNVGETKIAPAPEIGEFFVINSQLMEDGRPEVVNGRHLVDGFVAQLIRRSVCLTTLHAATGQPKAKAIRIMVPSLASFSNHSPENREQAYREARDAMVLCPGARSYQPTTQAPDRRRDSKVDSQ